MREFKAIYKDKRGEEDTIIKSDGSTMFFTLRGIHFKGTDFDMLTTEEIDHTKFDYEMFADGSGDLTNFKITATIPILFYNSLSIQTFNENLMVHIEVGETAVLDGLDSEIHGLRLTTSFGEFTLEKKLEWMEDALVALQGQLPEHIYLKTCLSCKFSHYHPVGNGMFGSLCCFRNFKKELQQVNDKYDLMDLWTDDKVQNESLFFVQETFDCEQHELLTDNDWCYKSWTKTM